MQELSKFKVITVVFLCLFVFVIGVIYTNTKEMAESNTGEKINNAREKITNEFHSERENVKTNQANIEDLNSRLNDLRQQVHELKSSGTGMNCKIRGVMGSNGLEDISGEAAFEEARYNGKDLVLTCKF
ncbi:hypothetical protein IJ579_07515 [bacterium]|nr:hypothetical protein [bacterium]